MSIVGMPYDEGRALIEEVNAMIVHDDLTYRHRWSPGQLIVWDNRCVLHRATAYDPSRERRVIRRCTVLAKCRDSRIPCAPMHRLPASLLIAALALAAATLDASAQATPAPPAFRLPDGARPPPTR
jgi:hypothetical protein